MMRRRRETLRNVYASHACFYLLTAAVPVLMLALMLIGRLLPGRTEELLRAALAHLPPQVAGYFPEEFVRGAMSAGLPVALAAVFVMLRSLLKFMRALMQGLCAVYGEKPPGDFFGGILFPALCSLVFFAAIVLALAAPVCGESILKILAARGSADRQKARLFVRLGRAAAFLLFVLLFAFLYDFLTARKYRFYRHLPGALFAAAGWSVYSQLFSAYLTLFSPERYLLYGGLGALLILLWWTHAGMTLTLLGGEVNVALLARLRVCGMVFRPVRALRAGKKRGGSRGEEKKPCGEEEPRGREERKEKPP